MVGVTHVQIQLLLRYDDGNVITLSSPTISKNIRDGDVFKDEEIVECLQFTDIELAKVIEEKTTKRIFQEMQAMKSADGKPTYWKRPEGDKPFSDN